MKKGWRWMLAVALVAMAFLGGATAALAETKSLEWQRLDTDIVVQPNGDLRITESNLIAFTSGTFSYGYRDIDMSRLTGIDDIRVTENGQPIQYETSSDGDTLRITYTFSTPARNETRQIVLEYTAKGAVRYYPDGDQVFWPAVYADRNGFPVQNSKATVALPEGATATRVETYGPQATVTGEGESLVVAQALEPIPSGQDFEIRVQFPHGIVSGEPSRWQAGFDQQRAFEETTKPAINLVVLLVGLLILFGGPALAVVLWYLRGRDPKVGLVADYLSEPPPGIAPGVAGTLIDERANMQDIIATLIDLARRGILVMEEQGSKNAASLFVSRDWTFSRGSSFDSQLAPHEQKLVEALGLHATDSVKLSSMRNKLYNKIGDLDSALYSQLIAGGFYQRRPDQVRGIYMGIASLWLVLTILFGCIGLVLLSDLTDFGLLVAIGLTATTVAFYIVAGQMPVRTRKGAEARMRLEAFKRYLQNVEKYADLKTATDQYEKYLPFAIAFGLDRSWTQKFAAVDTPAPTWYIPMGFPRRYGYDPSRPAAGGPVAGGPALGDIGDVAKAGGGLAGLDRSLTAGLSDINASLTSMFSSVGNTFTSQPAPKSSSSRSGGRSFGGGGWSGGGSFGGGSSGRGGGGFG